MATRPAEMNAQGMLPFERFWEWVQAHANCILRVSTDSAVVYDDDNFHWYLGYDETDGIYFIQAILGKRLIAEAVFSPSPAAFVSLGQASAEEFTFDIYLDREDFACQLVLAHGLDEGRESHDAVEGHGEPPHGAHWTH